MAIRETKVRQGTISGRDNETYTLFAGVPYAKPPVGTLRFCAPKKPEPWEGIYAADHFKSICFQNEKGPGEFYDKEFYSVEGFRTSMSEDCLYLNIWTPAQSKDEKLPVAFWIHGGAFRHGYGHEAEFDGAAYCKRGVILVTLNYRLGVFGFLTHPWLTEENPRHISGNYGCLDQIAALKWVKENISAFGGDPDNITVFGQSAGAMSTQTLISSPLTENWISKAIFQSAGGYDTGFNRDLTIKEAEEIGRDFTAYAKIDSLQELRAMDAETLCHLFIDYEYNQAENELRFIPNIDGYLLIDGYNASMEKGLVKNIPYMLGSTLNDLDMGVIAEDGQSALYRGCIAWSHVLEAQGREPAYVYNFQRKLPGDEAGAFHSSELWYIFGTLARCWRPMTEQDYILSENMLDCWSNFMKTGHPQKGWKPCRKEDAYVKVFDV